MVRARAPVIAVAALAGLAGCGVVAWIAPLAPWDVPVSDPPEALARPARTVYQEPSGVFWFATEGGAIRFDPRTGSFTRLIERDGLASTYVTGFQPDLGGGLWIGSGAGARRFDPRTGCVRDERGERGEPGAVFFGRPEEPWKPQEEESLRALVLPARGDRRAWGLDDRSWLFTLDPETREYKAFLDPALDGRQILALAPEPPGDVLWLGTSRGLLRLVRATGQLLPSRLAEGQVSAVHRDADGALWLWLDSRLARFVPSTGEVRVFAEPRGLGATVRALFRAPAGGPLWIASLDGPVRFDPATGAAAGLRLPGMVTNPVEALWREAGGAVWLTAPGSLVRLDPRTGRSRTAPADLLNDTETVTVFLQEDAGGAVWMATNGGSLVRFDPRQGSWSRPLRERLPGGVAALLQESGGGALWLAVPGSGVSRLDPRTGRLRAYTEADGLPGRVVQHLWRGGAMLLAGGHLGVARFDPAADRFVPWPPARAAAGRRVTGIVGEGRELWLATDEDLVRIDLETGASAVHSSSLLSPAGGEGIRRILRVPGRRSLWIETWDRKLLRFDTGSGAFASLRPTTYAVAPDPAGGGVWVAADPFDPGRRRRRALLRVDDAGRIVTLPAQLGRDVHVLLPDPAAGALWSGSSLRGIERAVFGGAGPRGEAGSQSRLPPPDATLWQRESAPPARLALAGRSVARSRGYGLAFAETRGSAPPVLSALPFDQPVWDLAPGPEGRVWAALRLGGIRLCAPGKGCASLAADGGLPSSDAFALAPVPGSGGRVVWVATAGGAARVRAEGGRLRVERTATVDDGLPSGPVDALAALPDGSVFLAFNALDPALFQDPELAARRSGTRVIHVPARGAPAPGIALAGSTVLTLGLSPDGGTLWAGAQEGLFAARDPRRPGSRFEAVAAFTGTAVSALAVDGRGTVWTVPLIAYGAPSVQGYRPGTRNRRTLGGLPESGAVDDLEISEDGELVVLLGSRLARGRVGVPPVALPGLDWIVFWLLLIVLLRSWRAVRRPAWPSASP